jgi:hypothetical protein
MNDSNLLPYIKLRFNIDHPSIEECYSYGYECARESLAEDANPFPEGSRASDEWLNGWWDGLYGVEPCFELYSEDVAVEDPSVQKIPANDNYYQDKLDSFFVKLLEISGVLAVSAFVGYQLIDLVA